jgi:hypothetical protein
MPSGVRVGTRLFMSAATPAACGAAAEVPTKFGKPVPSGSIPPKNVVSAPSGAVMSGCWRTSGGASRCPAVSKRMGLPPAEEKPSMRGGFAPKAGVCR